MKVFLKSPGGSGTKYLYSLYGKENLCGGRKWFNPHQRYDGELTGQVIYIMAHPLNILLSYDKSGFFQEEHMVRNIQGDVNSWRSNGIDSIDKYAEAGINMVNFEDHYLRCAKSNPLLITIIYEDLPSQLHKIPLTPIRENPFVKRRSNYLDADPLLIEKLTEIHKVDIDFYESLVKIYV